MAVKCITLVIAAFFIRTYGLNTNPSIIIIGSGPAAVAAATKLWKSNITNVKVLEAENRIGGRIHSTKFGDAFVDLGGEWCHGVKDNTVYNMVKQYNILRETNINTKIYYSNGILLDQEMCDNFEEFSESIQLGLDDFNPEAKCGNFSSVGECFDAIYNSTFTELYKNNTGLRTISLDAKGWIESYILSVDSALNLHDLAVKTDYKTCEGHLALNWDGRGYKTILELMLQQYPDPTQELPVINNFQVKKEVTKIAWSNNNNHVEVHCLDNTTYTADHVIFTPSLGVLKANHESLFKPTLPEDKVRAIRNIGFGAIMKIILIFPHTWWDASRPLAFIWSAEDREKILTEFGRGPVKDGRSWLTTHVAFLPGEQNPRVLIGFFAGDMIPLLEQESDEVLKAGCMYMFRKFLGGIYSNISDPDAIIRTTWYSNPHFRGTYSYDSASNTEKGLREKLAAPLTEEDGYPAVLFAGEATHHHYFSTVHGAIESGYREAQRLIDYYTKNKV